MLPVKLRNFELLTIIASGGMGTVYTAQDVNLQRQVALKMMKREMAADPAILQAFYREARASASLNHTNIIHIYSFDEFDGQPYLVMELADQGSLDSRIETEGRVPELDVLDVGIKICSALATALQHKLLHRVRPVHAGDRRFGACGLLLGLGRADTTGEAHPEHAKPNCKAMQETRQSIFQ